MKLPQLLLIFEVLLLYLALILQHLGASWLRLLLVLGVSAVLRDEGGSGMERAPGPGGLRALQLRGTRRRWSSATRGCADRTRHW